MEMIRVLLIDDEEELVSTLTERLKMRNIDAEYVVSGPDAMSRLEAKKFDAVLLDYKLPGMSGLEVMRKIHESYPGTKVLLFTGAGSVDEERNSIPEETLPDILLKPIDINVLIDKLKAAIQE